MKTLQGKTDLELGFVLFVKTSYGFERNIIEKPLIAHIDPFEFQFSMLA